MVLPLHISAQNLTPRILRSLFGELGRLTLEDLPNPIPSPIDIPAIGDDDDGDEHEVVKEEGKAAGKEDGQERGSAAKLDRETIYISIATQDSSIVYYKLTKGIKKPDDIPDE